MAFLVKNSSSFILHNSNWETERDQRPRSPIVHLYPGYPISNISFKIISRNILSFSKNISEVRINLSNEEDPMKDRNG